MASHRQQIFEVFLNVLSDNLAFPRLESILLVLFLFMLTLCGSSSSMCDESLVVQTTIRALSEKGIRYLLFGFLWYYMSIMHLWQATHYGLIWTFRDASTVARATFTSNTSTRQKVWTYATNVVDLGLGLMIQPLLFFLVTREMGKSPLFGKFGAESSFYSGIFLHGLRIIFEVTEQVIYDRTRLNLRLTLLFLLGTGLAICERRGYTAIIDTTPLRSWAVAKEYNALGIWAKDIGESVLRRADEAKQPEWMCHMQRYVWRTRKLVPW